MKTDRYSRGSLAGLACFCLFAMGPEGEARAQTLLERLRLTEPAQRELDIPVIELPAAEIVISDLGDQRGRDWRRIERFLIMRDEVTNRQFGAFVVSMGYVTDAERKGGAMVWSPGGSKFVKGANWLRPTGGEQGSIADQYPVTQVSQHDAAEFCTWAKMRLPRDEEWVYAARGALDGRPYPWGYDKADVKRGNFGSRQGPNDADGYLGPAPVGSYPAGASPWGVRDLSGNVREWTASPVPGRLQAAIIRGGSFLDSIKNQTVTTFTGALLNRAYDFVGFRCALSPPLVQAR